MALNKPVRNIAIVGTGVIGASWAAEFLARGFDVIATDPAPDAEKNLRKFVDAAWPALRAKGLSKNASRARLPKEKEDRLPARRLSVRKTKEVLRLRFEWGSFAWPGSIRQFGWKLPPNERW